jgi:anti-sigma factor RsiW
MTIPERPISEHELHAFIDGRLWVERQQDVKQFLDTQPELARRVAAYRAQRAMLRTAFGVQAEEPIPSALNLTRLVESRLRRRGGWRRPAAACAVALCLGGATGWYLSLPRAPDDTRLAVTILQDEALNSHAVYAADRRHPVEVTGAEQEHLAQWLSTRLRRNVAAPDLSLVGYKLMGGRLLATERGAAAALFMYDDGRGNRLSVVMRPMARELTADRTDMSQGNVNGCAWIEKGIGYAVVAAAPDEALDRVAEQISEQAGAPG